MPSEHYSEFIREAFVEPIRSVLIVDDDYPTFDEILGTQTAQNKHTTVDRTKSWYDSPERIKVVIDNFRSAGRSLLVDIHDGANVASGEEVKVAAHLHQSDLLVLDYQLDKSKPRDGSMAIEIIRSVMSNDHFNLVIIHTSEDLGFVFDAVLVGLMKPFAELISPKEMDEAEQLIEAAEDLNEGFSEQLSASASNAQYFHFRLHPTTYQGIVSKAQQPYSAFMDLSNSAHWSPDQSKLVLRYALSKAQQALLPKMNANSLADLTWSSGTTKWVRSDSVFIAFSNKSDEDDLLAELQIALDDWNPQPSRLFLAKLRAEMDEYGVMAQDQALGNKHALAHWYHRLLEGVGSSQRWHVAESVSRHSDQLMSAVLPRVEDFAIRLVKAEVESGSATEICKEHFKVDLQKSEIKLLANREHNAFVCSKTPQGWHLTTGHVFVMENTYWVCLSPACDMVPTQMSPARVTAFGENLPFIAVQLQAVEDGKEKGIQSNRFVFLQTEKGVKGFCFNNPSADNSAPQWHTLYAAKRGKFVDGTFDFHVLRTGAGVTRPLVSKKFSATVVSQLRYEYALNLMQRLGVSLTRIGLDFSG